MNSLPLNYCDLSLARPNVESIDAEDLIAGDPIIRYASLQETSDGNAVGLRDFSAGRFTRHYEVDEVLHIIEGGATVVDHSHRVWVLRTGDVVTFRQGSSARWQVPEYVRALSFTRRKAAHPTSYRPHALVAAKAIGAAVLGLGLAAVTTTATIAASMLTS